MAPTENGMVYTARLAPVTDLPAGAQPETLVAVEYLHPGAVDESHGDLTGSPSAAGATPGQARAEGPFCVLLLLIARRLWWAWP